MTGSAGPTWEWAGGLLSIEKVESSGWGYRTTALKLADGGGVVVNPTKDMSYAWPAEIGPPRLLLAPNKYHYLGLAEWSQRFVGVRAVATETARKRITRRTGVDVGGLDVVKRVLPSYSRLHVPDGTKNGEVWLDVETPQGVAWVVGDAFLHVVRPCTGAFGFLLRATGTVNGLRIGGTWRPLHLADKKRYRRWLEARIRERQPRILIPCHGEILRDEELPARLLALAAKRL